MRIFLKKFVKKRTKVLSRNSVKRRKNPLKKKVHSKSRKIVKRNNNYSFYASIFSSFIIFAGFISLSLSIFFLIRQLQPVIRNERLKFLCTYQLGDKKSQSYKESKLELEKLVGDSDKYCKNFLLPKEKTKKGFRLVPIMKNILFRFIQYFPQVLQDHQVTGSNPVIPTLELSRTYKDFPACLFYCLLSVLNDCGQILLYFSQQTSQNNEKKN